MTPQHVIQLAVRHRAIPGNQTSPTVRPTGAAESRTASRQPSVLTYGPYIYIRVRVQLSYINDVTRTNIN